MSANSANAQLNALFSGSTTSAEVNKNRIRFTKDELLAKFKQTKELDMNVFEANRILDYAALFISTSSKPTFSSSKKADENEERDPFDDMMDEAEESKKENERQGGLLPESLKKT